VDSGQEHVVVRLGGSRCALAMSDVAEVGRPPALTRVPGLPAWVAGAANWRGRVLAVLDLGTMLGAALPAPERSGRMVVLTRARVSVGILVETVEGTLQVQPERVEAALLHLPATTVSLLSGQLTDVDGPCALLDVGAVFALADDLPRARRTA
jgi:purine-binding chemotaxis protein CheW